MLGNKKSCWNKGALRDTEGPQKVLLTIEKKNAHIFKHNTNIVAGFNRTILKQWQEYYPTHFSNI